MRTFALSLSLLALSFGSLACKAGGGPAASPSPGELTTEDDKTLYALGLMVGGNLKALHLSATELEIVKKGMADAATGAKTQVTLETYGPKVQELAKARMTAGAQQEKEKAKAFADSAAKEPGAERTPSGLVIRSLMPGKGASPKATSMVKVHYEGKLADGTLFDSSIKRGQPAEFPLGGVIPCWTEALQKMKVGEKARIVCPADIAYGDQGRPPTIPGGATLVFEVELLEVK
jgi:FKBP-type peptidyl-prolyl cis-trans isomerase FkpA